MKTWNRVRASRGSWMVAAGAYLIGAAGALALRRAGGGSEAAVLAGMALLSVAMIVTAFALRSPLPRWSLVTVATIFSGGLIVAALVAPGPGAWRGGIDMAGYFWLYLVTLAGSSAAGPRWCHSPWVAVVGATALTAGLTVVAAIA